MRRKILLLFLAFCAACRSPYANVPPEPPAAYNKAEESMLHGEYRAAIKELSALLERGEGANFRARAYYQLARAYFEIEEYQKTLDTLDTLEAEYPYDNWPQVAALRGDAQFALGYKTEGFLAWEQAYEASPPGDRAVLRKRMQDTIADLNNAELREVYALVGLPEVYEIVATRPEPPPEEEPVELAKAAEPAPEPLPAAEPGAEPLAAPELEPPTAMVGIEPVDVLTPPDIESQPGLKVACLLPLTGPDKTYGVRALTGLRLAFEGAPTSLVIRDTGGDPQIASKALHELASSPTVLAVIGPLRSAEAISLAPRADKLRIPLVLLSQREGIKGSFVLPTSMTRARQVRALVEHATQVLGGRRFGVVYPDDNYGRTFMSLFRSDVQRFGGRLVGTRAYVPGQRSFDSEVATVSRWVRESEVDAVFIPDAAATAFVLATAIRQRNPNVALLGTESWNRPELLAAAGSAIDGAIFADAFFAGSPTPSTRDFVQRFQAYAGRLPTVFEAQAYDAGMIVRRALEGGALTRDELIARLKSAEPYEGAGRLYATDEGFDRELFLLRVHNGRVEEIPLKRSRVRDIRG